MALDEQIYDHTSHWYKQRPLTPLNEDVAERIGNQRQEKGLNDQRQGMKISIGPRF